MSGHQGVRRTRYGKGKNTDSSFYRIYMGPHLKFSPRGSRIPRNGGPERKGVSRGNSLPAILIYSLHTVAGGERSERSGGERARGKNGEAGAYTKVILASDLVILGKRLWGCDYCHRWREFKEERGEKKEPFSAAL